MRIIGVGGLLIVSSGAIVWWVISSSAPEPEDGARPARDVSAHSNQGPQNGVRTERVGPIETSEFEDQGKEDKHAAEQPQPIPATDIHGVNLAHLAKFSGLTMDDVRDALRDPERAARVKEALEAAEHAIWTADTALNKETHSIRSKMIKSGQFRTSEAPPMLSPDGSAMRGASGDAVVKQTIPRPDYPGQVVRTSLYRDKSTGLMMQRVVRIDPSEYPKVARLQTTLTETQTEQRARVRAAVTAQ